MPYFPPPQTGATFANPTASIGLAAVNGVATTAMRSDAAPVIDLTAAFTFTGLGATNLLSASALSWNSDLILTRGAAAVLQFGAANVDTGPVAQTVRAQGVITGSGTSNVAGAPLTIASGQGKGNATGSSLIFQTPAAVASGTGAQTMTTALTLNGSQQTVVIAGSRALPAIVFSGAATTGMWLDSGTTWRVTFGGVVDVLSAINGIGIQTQGSYYYGFNGRSTISSPANASLQFTNAGATQTINLTFPVNDTWQFGLANAASPVAQTLQAQGSRAGTDSNVGGAGVTIQSGLGTGTGTRSTLTLRSPVVVASGTGAQTQTAGLVIDGGTAVSTGYTVATLPATPLTGARAHVTDALAPTFLATIVGGGAITTPVFYNGANWVGG